MLSPKFQLNKFRRLICTVGEHFTFTRSGSDEYGEPSEEQSSRTFPGVFHEAAGYVYLGDTPYDAATRVQRVMPMILMLRDDAINIERDDRLHYNGHVFRVIEVKDVSDSGVVADLSLEELYDTSYLVTDKRDIIVFGDTRILLGV